MTLAKVLLSLAVSALLLFPTGATVQALWGWYVEPLGLPALSLPAAMGVNLTVAFISHQRQLGVHDVDLLEETAEGAFYTLGLCGLALLFGWGISLFL